MKSSADPRHQKRRQLVKALFAVSFSKNNPPIIKDILDDIDKIDQIISQSAPSWPLDKLNKIDLSILRLAVHELLNKTSPSKVIIDEAVELAKEYGSENSSSFVNGVLGTVLIKQKKDKK